MNTYHVNRLVADDSNEISSLFLFCEAAITQKMCTLFIYFCVCVCGGGGGGEGECF